MEIRYCVRIVADCNTGFLYRYVLSCGTDILIYNMFDTFITYIFYI